jgi:hypothetical protein
MQDRHLLVTLAALSLVACQFRHGSGPSRDSAPADVASHDGSGSADARVMGDAQRDAADLCVSSTCQAAGGNCVSGTCVIVRTVQAGVTCPSGMPCQVQCDVTDACKTGGVSCGGATTCDVSCVGTSTCQNGGVDCGSATTCTVHCVGSSTCQNGMGTNPSVQCEMSTCTVTCDGSSSCQAGISVGSGGTCTSHCCNGACQGGYGMCTDDSVCI